MSRQYLHAADVKALTENKYYITNPVNAPNTLTSYVDVKESPLSEQRKSVEVVPVTGNTKYIARLSDNGTWSAWDSFVLNTDLASKNQKITAATSTFEFAGSPYIWCMKSGNMVSCIGKLKAISAITTRTVAFTIPVGFRPSDYIAIDLLSRQGYVNVDITPSTGEVTVYPNIQSGDIVNINITWTVK